MSKGTPREDEDEDEQLFERVDADDVSRTDIFTLVHRKKTSYLPE